VGDHHLQCAVELTWRSPGALQKFTKLPSGPLVASGSKSGNAPKSEEKTSATISSMPRLRSSRSSELRKFWTTGVQHLNRAVKVMDRTALDSDRARSRSRTQSTVARSPPDSEEGDESEGDEEESSAEESEEDAESDDYHGNN
jgi:hypothetical protein